MWTISLYTKQRLRNSVYPRNRASGSIGRIAGPAHRKRFFVPRLEILECRTVPSLGPLVAISVPDPLAGCQHDQEWQYPHGGRDAQVEPWLAVNPTNQNNMAVIWVAHDFSGNVASVTLDGGTTWQNVAIPGISKCTGGTANNGADPWLAFAPNGVLYAASDSNGSATDISRSLDGGLTWSDPITLSEGDRPSVTADPGNSNLVYAVWNNGAFGGTSTVQFTRTTDGGQTWEPDRASYTAPAGNVAWNAKVEPLPDGTLVCLFTEEVLTGYAKKVPQYNYAFSVMRSTDKGQTWSAPTKVLAQIPRSDPNPQDQVWWAGVTDADNGKGISMIGAFHSTAVDPRNGNLYAVWTDARFSGGQSDSIAFSRSTDGGVTWSDPIQVNRTPTNLPALDRQAWYPTVAVAADGTIGVSYYDLRFNDASRGCLTDYWLVQSPSKSSTDPASWTNETRLTDTSFDIEQSVSWSLGGANAYWLGDYQGLAAVGNGFGAVWAQPFAGSPDHILFRQVGPSLFDSPNAIQMASQSAGGFVGSLANALGAVFIVSGPTLSGNSTASGAGGWDTYGGNGLGGGFNDGQSSLEVCGSTVTDNTATGGAAGSGGKAGQGVSGELYLAAGGHACLDAFTLSHVTGNHASTGTDDIFGDFNYLSVRTVLLAF
jgi:hypothetical protein